MSISWKAFVTCIAGYLGAQSVSLDAAPASPRVRIVAYINVTSGCQEPTVQYLKRFARHAGKAVSLEIVDFGSEQGRIRWRRDGYNCETIIINGSNQFRIGKGQNTRIVVLKMPEGVRWTFDDLGQVLQQELRAPRSTIANDTIVREVARNKPIASRSTNWKGKPVGEVLVGAQTVFRFVTPFAGKSAAERAARAATTLRSLYHKGLRADDVDVERLPYGDTIVGVIVAAGEEIATVTEAEAAIIRRKPPQAAMVWAFNLRDALRILGR